MSPSNACARSSGLILFLTLYPSFSTAAPITHLYKRSLGTGAKAGIGIGIAVIAIIFICVAAFFVIHLRRSRHNAAINRERAILAGEKNKDGSDKVDKFAPEPVAPQGGMPRRNKSIKDRMMGPLYRGSMIDMMPVPRAKLAGGNPNRSSTATTNSAHWDNVDGQPFLHKPFAGSESSPRPSFSSKRATRMMMMM